MRPALLLWCLPATLIFLLAAAPASAHAPPPVYLTSELNSEELVVTCVLGHELFKDWLGLDPTGWKELEDEARAGHEAAIEAFFAEWGGVEADGIEVKGLFRGLENVVYEAHDQDWKFVHVKIAYGMKAMPNQLSLTWKRFENNIGWFLDYIQGEIIVEGFGGRYFDFSAEEPEYVWHQPATPRLTTSLVEPGYTPPPPLTIPLLSMGVLLLLAAALPFFRAFQVPRRVAWSIVVLGAVLTLALSGQARVEVEAPWRAGVRLPDEAEAREIFATLHRNIYRAFDYTAEEDVYDTLARSVTGPLLDRLYGEIKESLIMEDQGGAVSRIQGVRILEAKVELPKQDDLPEYWVVCTWQVKGRVSHWGHTHERINEYEARYRVESDGQKWRIGEVVTLDERRLDEDEAARTWVESEGE